MEINDCEMEIDKYQSPMDSSWFYSKNNIFINANKFHEYQCWKNAIASYEETIYNLKEAPKKNKILLNHLSMAVLNLAACLMAEGEATEHWSIFDYLLEIPQNKQISKKIIENAKENGEKTVLVRTHLISINDIVCFLSAVNTLKERTGWNIILEVSKFLIAPLQTAANIYSFNLYSPQTIEPAPDYETHLVSLLGHLKLTPANMNPEKVIFTAPEKAINAIYNLIKPTLEQNHYIAAIDRGKVDQQAIAIGGRELRNRYLDAKPFKQLLKKHPNLTLLDCSKIIDRVIVSKKQQNQYLIIPEGIAPLETPLDTIIALGHLMNNIPKIVAFATDMGHTNVLIQSLNSDAQKHISLIIPVANEHDIRMSGKGSVYKHMIFSNCLVYKCNTLADQTKMIEFAYQNMINKK